MTSYLVTGGAGFIGSHLVEELLRRGREVRVLDNYLTGRRENLAAFLGQIEILEGDIRDPDACARAVGGVDYVLHQAALPSVPRSLADPVLTDDINVRGTLNVLKAARDAGVRRLVFASSSSCYGDDPGLPKKEGREGRPLSPYAVSKIAGERYLQVFTLTYGLEAVALRYFNVFGPRQDPASAYAAVIPRFITQILRNERPVVFGDGEQSRDFTYVADVVAANLLACEAPGAEGRILNIAGASRITVNELAGRINACLGTSLLPEHVDPRPGDIRHSYADISDARAVLGFAPSVGLDEGLKRTIAWYRRSGGAS